jgi:integrase/recombinase XerD
LALQEDFSMKRRPQGSLPLSKAIPGFLQFKAAEGLSPNTLQSYQRDLKLWQIYAGDIPVESISTKIIQAYLVWLRTDYEPRRLSGDRRALASKTIHNFYVSLSAFFTWASREFDLPNPIKAVPPPKFQQAPIEPFTKEEVELRIPQSPFVSTHV